MGPHNAASFHAHVTDRPCKAVFLTSDLPFPATGGARLRDSHLLKLLSEKVEVEIVCFSRTGAAPPRPSLLGDVPYQLRVTEIPRERSPLWRRALSPVRPYVVNGYSYRIERALRERFEPGKLLWISRLNMAQYIPLAKRLGYRIVLDDHNVESSILLAGALSSVLSYHRLPVAAQCAYYEGRFCEESNAVVAASQIDASKLKRLAPDARVHVIPNSVDALSYQPVRANVGSTLFFSGTLSYAPNIEGLEWFIAEILPRLRAALGPRMPEVVVAGSDPSSMLFSHLKAAGIRVHANPEHMMPLIGEAAVVFVPIHSGSGTRLKILEAMASGRAVVSTCKGAEGLDLSPSFDIFVADPPDTFTSAIVRLLRDPELRARVGANAARTIEERYDWRCARPLIEDLLGSLQKKQPQ